MRGKKKFIGLLLVGLFIITIIVPGSVYAENILKETMEPKPDIKVNYLGTTPESPMEGLDFTVTYQLDPQPFQQKIETNKEIVLVLDKSGSMKDNNKMTNLIVAAKEFIDSLTEIDEVTKVPKVSNLSVAVVAYDSNGNIKKELLKVTNDEAVITANVRELKKVIDTLTPKGGTNIGDGLRKASYLLKKSKDEDANKTIIFMADGQPTYYSAKSKNDSNYYTTLDNRTVGKGSNSKPYLRGSGRDDSQGYCLEYAKTIGTTIKTNNYNVFSIGYGLGDENSTNNKKMKAIHEAMGGVSEGDESTFFATDSGAIDSIFQQIADKLQSSYSIGDVNMNLNLGDSITAVSGFEVVDGNGAIIKAPPIVYALQENNWYTAEPVTISFVVKANKAGEKIEIIKPGSNITYTDVNGVVREVPIGEQSITVRPYEVDEAEKLQVDFKSEKEGYLIGDKAKLNVTLTYPNIKNVSYSNAIFNITDIPTNLEFINESKNNINFGNVEETRTESYNVFIQDDSKVTTDTVTTYNIVGSYEYDMKKGTNKSKEEGNREATVNVKRGQIRVEVIDEEGNNITKYTNISVSDRNLSLIDGNFTDGMLEYNDISTGNYKIAILGLPDGCSIDEEDNNVQIRVDYSNNVVTHTYKVEGKHSIESNDSDISILEVEPADSFLISNKDGHVKTGVEKTTVVLDDGSEKAITIEHVSMQEFIGKIDKLNGKYDIIVIGRFNDNINITDNKNVDQVAYRDYNNDKLWNNDITDRKAIEIKEFINTNQLVYIDNNIVKNDSNLKNLKLYKQFTELNTDNNDNCITEYTIKNINLNMIVEEYCKIENEYKRIDFGLETPDGDLPSANIGNPEKRNMEFIVTPNDTEKSIVDINLYLDISGDGLFQTGEDGSKNELVKILKDVDLSKGNVMVTHQMASDFIGYLDWKLEIVKGNNVKTYEVGAVQFRSLTGEKMPIKVLQVSPFAPDGLEDKVYGNLNLGPVNEGGNERFNELLSLLKDYDVDIDVISMKEFNGRLGKTQNQINSDKTLSQDIKNKGSLVLNGIYQMVIFGFADTYGGWQNDIVDSAVQPLLNYINTGQGVMFTHDTFWSGSSSNRIEHFADIVGQNKDISTFATNKGWANSQSKTVYQTNEALITNYPFNLDSSLDIRRTHGQWYQLDLENENVVPWYTTKPNTVNKKDSDADYEGTIPNDIIEELKKSGLTVDDMKKDDINAGFTGSNGMNKENTTPSHDGVNLVNPYDVKNNYYTYSIKNITFSGTAENTKEKFTPYPTEELKLFVNTITKAIRGANHAPVINESNIYDGMEIDKDQENFKFAATFTDIDNDTISTVMKIDGKVVDEYKKENINAGSSIEYVIPKLYYDGKKEITIEITAEDKLGAKAEKKVFKIIPTTLPIKIDIEGSNGLIGDILNTGINIDVINTDTKEIKNITVEVFRPSSNLLQYESSQSDALITNLGKLDDGSVELDYNFIAKSEIQGYTVKAVVKYVYIDKASGVRHEKSIPVDIPINIKSGEINVNINNISNRDISNVLVGVGNGIQNKPLTTSNINFNKVKTFNNYKISLENLSEELRLADEKWLDTNGKPIETVDGHFKISYDNPKVTYNANVVVKTTIKHGIYDGLSDDNDILVYEIEDYKQEEDNDRNGREYARDAQIPFAASLDVYNDTVINLKTDRLGEVEGEISVYKLENNKLVKLGDMNKKENLTSVYSYDLKGVESSTKIVILYNYKLTGVANEYINNIEVYNIDKDAKAKVEKGVELPDLF